VAQVIQLDVSSAIRLPQDTTDFVVSRDSLIAIAENLQITNGIIRVRTTNGSWTEFNIQNIRDVVLPLDNSSSSVEIEVLEEGSSSPVTYSIPISRKGGLALWPTQILIFTAGLAALWFLVLFVRRRRDNEPV